MSRIRNLALAGGLSAAALALAVVVPGQRARTADHLDPPSRTDPTVDPTPDAAADLADIFAWNEGTNTNIIITFAGPNAPNLPAVYDRDILYKINISNKPPAASTEIPITIRFGKGAGPNDFGVQVSGIPGVGVISGPVEQTLTSGGVTVRAGLFDDPFFFDSQGLKDTRATGTLMIQKNRNFFAGKNDTAVVLQIPTASLVSGTNPLNIWASTARFGGQI